MSTLVSSNDGVGVMRRRLELPTSRWCDGRGAGQLTGEVNLP
jgi:hypothetical protein